jgi:hypothetical protein
MATMPSKTTKRIHGLVFTVLSSPDGTTVVGAIGSRTDIRHWVTVENLGGYPADIKCRGRIASSHPAIKFDSGQAGDTAKHWGDQYRALPDQAIHSFKHVTLLPASKGSSGAEIIYADVSVTCPQPARQGSATIDIQVST